VRRETVAILYPVGKDDPATHMCIPTPSTAISPWSPGGKGIAATLSDLSPWITACSNTASEWMTGMLVCRRAQSWTGRTQTRLQIGRAQSVAAAARFDPICPRGIPQAWVSRPYYQGLEGFVGTTALLCSSRACSSPHQPTARCRSTCTADHSPGSLVRAGRSPSASLACTI